MFTELITGDFTTSAWLLLVEDDGPRGTGRVIGYFVFRTEDAAHHLSLCTACDALGLFQGMALPPDVTSEVLTYGDFIESYGNRMPLHNRYQPS